MNFKLREAGLGPSTKEADPTIEGCTDVAQVLQRLREGKSSNMMKGQKNLSSYELKELTKKDGENLEQNMLEQGQELDEAYLADKIEGLGHSKKEHINSGVYSGMEAILSKEQKEEMNHLGGQYCDQDKD